MKKILASCLILSILSGASDKMNKSQSENYLKKSEKLEKIIPSANSFLTPLNLNDSENLFISDTLKDYKNYYKRKNILDLFRKFKKKNFIIDFINPAGGRVPFLSDLFYANIFKSNKLENTEQNLEKMPKMNYTLILNLNTQNRINLISKLNGNYFEYQKDPQKISFYDLGYEGRLSYKVLLPYMNIQPYIPLKISYTANSPLDYNYEPRFSEIGKGIVMNINLPIGLKISIGPYELKRYEKENKDDETETGLNTHIGIKNQKYKPNIKYLGFNFNWNIIRKIENHENFKKHYTFGPFLEFGEKFDNFKIKIEYTKEKYPKINTDNFIDSVFLEINKSF